MPIYNGNLLIDRDNLTQPRADDRTFTQTGKKTGDIVAADVHIASGGIYGPEDLSGISVSIGAASTQSSAITGLIIDVVADVDCFIAIGANPTAAANTSYRLVKNTTYRFPITSGNKVAVIQDVTTGTLWIHPVS